VEIRSSCIEGCSGATGPVRDLTKRHGLEVCEPRICLTSFAEHGLENYGSGHVLTADIDITATKISFCSPPRK
jgi:hypothetical protein